MGSGKTEDHVLENLNKEILRNMRSKFPNLLIWAREHISTEIDSGISERKKNRNRKRRNFSFFFPVNQNVVLVILNLNPFFLLGIARPKNSARLQACACFAYRLLRHCVPGPKTLIFALRTNI